MRIARSLIFSFTLLLSLAVSAQTFEQLTFLRFNDAPMSIRAQAMGGVSEDDPSGNPASLASVKSPLLSLAGSRVSYRLGDIVYLDPNYVVSRRRDVHREGLSHVMVAVPVRSFVLGAWYRNEPEVEGLRPLVNGGVGPWAPSQCTTEPCQSFVFVAESPAFERSSRRYGGAVGWERGTVAIGIGAEIHELDERIDAMRTRFSIEPAFNDRISLRTDGREIVPNAGVRWAVTPRIVLGAAYQGGATFKRTNRACYAQGEGCGSEFVVIGESEQKTPDAYRASVSFAPLSGLRIAAEAVRRNYSEIDSFDETLMPGSPDRPLPYQDVTELHAGAEYRIQRLALRAGWWRDPARVDNAAYPDFALGNRTDHVTFGAGYDFGGGRLDVAFDDPEDEMLRRASIGVTLGVPSLQGR